MHRNGIAYSYWIIIAVLFIIAALVYPYRNIAMWYGFALAAYAAIANDSIQTIGTFIASNKHRKWYWLWIFMGSIFVITVTVSWVLYDGDVSHGRLMSKGFREAPQSFSYLQIAAPIVLLVITRLRMPVSTTFLLLNAFATSTTAIMGVLEKSLSGYFLAFLTAIFVWFLIESLTRRYFKGKAGGWWVYAQWLTSGSLWAVWIAQDAANIAIFLPRSLSLPQFLGFTIFIFLGLALLFYMKGDKIQGIVDEKSGVHDVRAATIIDFVYAILLYYKLFESNTPMSTTWLFLGLLGGREMAIGLSKKLKKRRKITSVRAVKMILRDLGAALTGLVISMILALAINDNIRQEIIDYLFH